MTLNPPAHICGPMDNFAPLSVRQERWQWIKDQIAAGHEQRAIADALGVCRGSVSKTALRPMPTLTFKPRPEVRPRVQPAMALPMQGAQPAMTYTRTSGPFSHREAPVSLPRAPWEASTATPDPRPETAPPRGIKGRPVGSTIEERIAAIREMRDEMRAGA